MFCSTLPERGFGVGAAPVAEDGVGLFVRGRGAARGVGNGSWLQYNEASLASSTQSEARVVGVDLFDLFEDTL